MCGLENWANLKIVNGKPANATQAVIIHKE